MNDNRMEERTRQINTGLGYEIISPNQIKDKEKEIKIFAALKQLYTLWIDKIFMKKLDVRRATKTNKALEKDIKDIFNKKMQLCDAAELVLKTSQDKEEFPGCQIWIKDKNILKNDFITIPKGPKGIKAMYDEVIKQCDEEDLEMIDFRNGMKDFLKKQQDLEQSAY